VDYAISMPISLYFGRYFTVVGRFRVFPFMQAGMLFSKNTYTEVEFFKENRIIAPLGTLGMALSLDLGGVAVNAGASGSLVYERGELVPFYRFFFGIDW
jgi:hypothetical protein